MVGDGIGKRILPLAGWSVVVALIYFGSAKAGLALAFATPSVTAIWPPTGIALVALVLGGRRLWPGVALGAFLANVTTDVPLYTTLGITLGNTLEALVGASLLRWVGFRPSLRRLRDLFALVALAAIVSTTVSATIGVASLSLGDSLNDPALTTWRVWWLGDMGGDLLVAPFLFVAVIHWPYRDAPGRTAEAIAMFAGLTAVGLLVFSHSAGLAYFTFPFLIWAALRFLQPGATIAALVVAIVAVAFTANGKGQFIQPSEDDSLLLAQSFAGVTGLSALVLAIVADQRRRAQRTAQEVAHALQVELLPPGLPEIPRIDTATWYRAGAQEQEVGGDFFDVFEAAPNQWMVAIGDVCGKGPEAASLTALARYTLRAVAREPLAPSDVLRALNDAILEQRSDQRFMTVSLARLKASGPGHTIDVSNGGHPLPFVVRARGDVEEVGAPGTLLGIYGDPKLEDRRAELRPGDALLLFTDGLIEGGRPGGDPTGWLRAALRASAGGSASEIAAEVQDAALARNGELADDLALLVLRARAA